MNQQVACHTYDPNRLLDALMARFGTTSDKVLSRKLQVARRVIRSIRIGTLPIGASMLLWFSQCAGTSIDELRRILGDRRAKARLSCALALP
jgi:hypothetical protein